MYSELIDQKIHTPNEKYCLDRFISTCTTVSMLFSKLLSVYTFPLGIFFSEIYLIINLRKNSNTVLKKVKRKSRP